MTFIPNDWARIRAHYAKNTPKILAAGRNEWGIDAYEWDTGMLFMTPIERWLWAEIRMVDAVLYPQYPVGRFFVDFANPCAKVAIECDGAAYHQDKAKDAARDQQLAAMGWTVHRIPGYACADEGDHEAGKIGAAYAFMRRVADEHGISRNTRTTEQDRQMDDDWLRFGDIFNELLMEARNATAAPRKAL